MTQSSNSIAKVWYSSRGNLPFLAPADSDYKPEYVSWIDVMGIGSALRLSLPQATNFIMKLHIAGLRARAIGDVGSISMFPMIDGMYVTSPVQRDVFAFIYRVFSDIAVNFINETNNLHRFLIRGSLAYGPVMKGSDHDGGSPELKSNKNYRSTMLLGTPIAQAYLLESGAPPFGIITDQSTRVFSPGVSPILGGLFWRWWEWDEFGNKFTDVNKLHKELKAYFKWCGIHAASRMYKLDRQEVHSALAEDYFSK